MQPRMTEYGQRVEDCNTCPRRKTWGKQPLCNTYMSKGCGLKVSNGKIIDDNADAWCPLKKVS